MTAERDDLAAKLKALQGQMADLDKKYKDLKKEMDGNANMSKDELEKLKKKLADAEGQNKQLKAENGEVNKKLDGAQKDLKNSNDKNSQLEKENADLRAQLKALQEKLAA